MLVCILMNYWGFFNLMAKLSKFSLLTLFTMAYCKELIHLLRSRLGRLMNNPTQQCNMKFIFRFIYVDLLNAWHGKMRQWNCK